MDDGRRFFSATPPLDVRQLFEEARRRWLRPAEICVILRNYQMFRIESQLLNRPGSGTIFLFDREVVRCFRRDGHNWRKRKDGKTVNEAHEKLKDESIDVLHCYYAHGEDNNNFQRRIYWLLEEELKDIVLVHYLEVTDGKSSRTRKLHKSSDEDTAVSTGFNTGTKQSWEASNPTNVGSSSCILNPADTDAANLCRPRSGYDAFTEMQQPVHGHLMGSWINSDDPYLSSNIQNCYEGLHPTTALITGSTVADMVSASSFHDNHLGSSYSSSTFSQTHLYDTSVPFMEPDTISARGGPEFKDLSTECFEVSIAAECCEISQSTDAEDVNDHLPRIENFSLSRLGKHDSFARWAMEFVDDLEMDFPTSTSWATEDSPLSYSEDEPTISPSLSQEQLFSIINLSPCFAYVGSDTKVLIVGTFLKQDEEIEKYNWSCMFDDIEVPAEVLAGGTIRCYAPQHKRGRVPFYITRSDRFACSEVREFEYRETDEKCIEESAPVTCSVYDKHLQIRLEKLLSSALAKYNRDGKCYMSTRPSLFEDEWSGLQKLANEGELKKNFSDRNSEKATKEKLCIWLKQIICGNDGKGAAALCKEGQGVIHLAAGLGYHWALKHVIAAGVNVNLRDTHGWTALHWAAFCGRERMVASLVAAGAATGLLADPTSEFPSARTPADLASANGHKGIAGFLAESSLITHFSTLTLKLSSQGCGETKPSGFPDRERSGGSSSTSSFLNRCDGAVLSAAQAFAGIYQAFRVQSFQRKNLADGGIPKEATLGVPRKDMHRHYAASRIQNKFRGWKGRRKFLIVRQHIIKIQACVRGHQARKKYEISWSMRFVLKAQRWRRRALNGIQPPEMLDSSLQQHSTCRSEDNYDLLREGRKDVEARFRSALDRVRSMVRYPDGRDQYQRLLNAITEIQEPKATEMQMEHEFDMDHLMDALKEFGEDDTAIQGFDAECSSPSYLPEYLTSS